MEVYLVFHRFMQVWGKCEIIFWIFKVEDDLLNEIDERKIIVYIVYQEDQENRIQTTKQ